MSQSSDERTVGQLVVEQPARARVFEQLGIDYCCGGNRRLADVCRERRLDYKHVVAKLNDELAARSSSPSPRRWESASLTDLCDHIEQTHHTYLKDEIPRLRTLLDKLQDRHGASHPELLQLRKLYAAMSTELELHMMKEECILFPLCRKLDSATEPQLAPCGPIRHPIDAMIHEHADAGDALSKMKALTNNFSIPPVACNTYRVAMEALKQFELDLHEHVHKENNILFPKVLRLDAFLTANPAQAARAVL